MSDNTATLLQLKAIARQFIVERDWNRYHPAKNLAVNLVVESTELLEIFTWLTPEQSEEKMKKENRSEVEHELADVFFSLLAICAKYEIDLSTAFEAKMKLNAQKYPIEKSYGINKKYTEL